MKTLQKYGLILLVFLLLVGLWAWRYWADTSKDKPDALLAGLALAINTCDGIAEKSVAHLTAQVEFQLLEIAGRRARVLQNCMNDQGYSENPAWVNYAEPIAQKNAQAQQISVNEAYENMRRKSMLLADTHQNTPLYWLAKSAN